MKNVSGVRWQNPWEKNWNLGSKHSSASHFQPEGRKRMGGTCKEWLRSKPVLLFEL